MLYASVTSSYSGLHLRVSFVGSILVIAQLTIRGSQDKDKLRPTAQKSQSSENCSSSAIL